MLKNLIKSYMILFIKLFLFSMDFLAISKYNKVQQRLAVMEDEKVIQDETIETLLTDDYDDEKHKKQRAKEI